MVLFAYSVTAAAICGVIIGVLAVRRMRGHTMVGAVLVTAFFTLTTATAGMMAFAIVANAHAQLTYPRYDARIIDYISEWQHRDDGPSQLMHKAVLQFTDQTGEVITRNSINASRSIPEIGGTERIYYRDGRAQQPTLIAYLIAGFFLATTGTISMLGAIYAGRIGETAFTSLGGNVLIYVLIPVGACALIAIVAVPLSSYMFGGNTFGINIANGIILTIVGGFLAYGLFRYVLLVTRAEKDPGQKIK